MFLFTFSLHAQVESIESTEPTHYVWISHGRIEGHLALKYSPAGAFCPDGSTLAVISDEKIVLLGTRDANIEKVLKLRIPGLTDLNIESANFLAMNQLFLFLTGVVSVKGAGAGGTTPLLGLQWDTIEDRPSTTLEVIGKGGGIRAHSLFPSSRNIDSL